VEISCSNIRAAPFWPTIAPSRATISPLAIVMTGHPVNPLAHAALLLEHTMDGGICVIGYLILQRWKL
jgi:hypothetical protein